ncbi:MAG: hypothetical protein WD906_04580 [Anaerolineales bacterium]
MPAGKPEYRILVMTRRFLVPGVLDTLSDQAPAIEEAMGKFLTKLSPSLDTLDGGGWEVVSHSVTFHSGLIVGTFFLRR